MNSHDFVLKVNLSLWRTIKFSTTIVTITLAPSTYKMVNFCAIVGCSNRSDCEKDRSYFSLPKVTQKQDEGRILSKRRRECWVSAISRSDLNLTAHHTRVCLDHFISGKIFCLTKVCRFISLFELQHIKAEGGSFRPA